MMGTRLDSVAILGGGNMAGAIAKSLIATARPEGMRVTTGSTTPSWVHADGVEHRTCALDPLANLWAASGADAVILGVKPPGIAPLAAEIAPALKPGALVISVAVGVTLDALAAALPAHAVPVRAMPNTPVAIGRGITAISLKDDAPEGSAERVRALLAPTGVVRELPERSIDNFSAVFGSGPAYVYYVMEALASALDEQGLTDEATGDLVAELVSASAAYLQSDGREAVQLRAEVTSPGGSTARAIGVFDDRDVRGAIGDGVRAAAMRARELGHAAPQR